MSPPNCICDKCGAEFDIELRETVSEGIRATWFRCPGCGWAYIPVAEDAALMKEKRRYRNRQARLLRKTASGRMDAEEYEAELKVLRDMRENIRKRVLELAEEIRPKLEDDHGTV